MGILKEEMRGIWGVSSEADVILLHRTGNNRSQQIFDALQAFAATPAEIPTSLADMQDTYTLATIEDVDAVLNSGGIRGHEFMSVLSNLGVPGAAAITTAGGTAASPAVVTLSGVFEVGQTLTIALDTDTAAGQNSGPQELTTRVGPVGAAAALAPLLQAALTDVSVTANGDTLEFLAINTATTVTVTAATVA